jgi:hypothetical protein
VGSAWPTGGGDEPAFREIDLLGTFSWQLCAEAAERPFVSWIEDRAKAYRNAAAERLAAAETALADVKERVVEKARSAVAAPEPSKAVLDEASRAAADFAKNASARARATLPSSVIPKPRSLPSVDVPGKGEPGSVAETARPYVMAAAGFGTAVVTGKLGPAGAIAEHVIVQAVDHYGRPEDKLCFGAGEMSGAALNMAEGVVEASSGGSVTIATAGMAAPITVPVAIVGGLQIAVATTQVADAQWLISRGSSPALASTSTPDPAPPPLPPAAAAPSTTPAPAPRPNINEAHLLHGEINPTNGKAGGWHWKGPPGANPNARVVPGKRTPPDARGVYREKVQIRDPNTGKWITKKSASTFFPDHYTEQQVKDAVHEAYADAVAKKQVQPDGFWEGKSSAGIPIEGWLEPNGIKTAYPKWEP